MYQVTNGMELELNFGEWKCSLHSDFYSRFYRFLVKIVYCWTLSIHIKCIQTRIYRSPYGLKVTKCWKINFLIGANSMQEIKQILSAFRALIIYKRLQSTTSICDCQRYRPMLSQSLAARHEEKNRKRAC